MKNGKEKKKEKVLMKKKRNEQRKERKNNREEPYVHFQFLFFEKFMKIPTQALPLPLLYKITIFIAKKNNKNLLT